MKRYLRLALVVIVLVAAGLLVYDSRPHKISNQTLEDQRRGAQAQQTPEITPDVDQLLVATNRYRSQANIGPLVLSAQLNRSADLKCKQMQNDSLFGHEDNSGIENGLAYIKQQDSTAQHYSENLLAVEYTSEQDVIDRWFNEVGTQETGHKESILNSNFTSTGFAFCTNNNKNFMFVQHFSD